MSDHFGKISIQHPAPAEPAEPAPAPQRPSRKTRPPSPPKPARSKPKPKSKPKSGGRILIWFLLLVLFASLYSAAGIIGVPYYVSTILPKTIFDKTGLIFQAQTVKFNPLTFVFSAEGSKLLSADETLPDLLKVKSIRAKFRPLSLLRNDLVSDSITIEELEAHITRKADGSYIFSSLFSDTRQANSAEMMDFSDLPFQFSLNNISVSKSKIIFSDLPLKKTHRVEDIQLALPTFSNFPFQAGNYIQPHFSATINGSPLELTGKASVGNKGDSNHATDLSCDIHGLNLPLYFGYLPFTLPIDITEGTADGKVGLTFNPGEKKGKKLAFTFDFKINKTKLSTHNGSLKVAAPAISLTGSLHPVSRSIRLKTLSLRDPIISSIGDSFTDNIRTLFKSSSKPDQLKPQTTAPVKIDIGLAIIDGAVLHKFNSKSPDKPDSSWNSIQLSLKNYSTSPPAWKNTKPGSFRLTGDQSETSSIFSWQGELAGPKLLDGSLIINNIQTATLFQAFGLKPFTSSKGLADLKGRLRLNLAESPEKYPAYSLTNTSISIQNFSMMDKKSPILSTPLLTLSGFSTSVERTDFGNIIIDNGKFNFTQGHIPHFLAIFSKDNHRIQSINFAGKATLSASKKSGSKVHFTDLTLKAKELGLAEKTKNNISITSKVSGGGILKASGSVTLSPFSTNLKTEFNRLPSDSVFSWLTSSPFLTNLHGRLRGNGIFTLPKVAFTGKLNLDDVTFTKNDKSVIKWKTGSFEDVNFTAKPFHLGIVSAELESPSFSWKISSNDNSPLENLTNFLQQKLLFSRQESKTKKNITLSSFDLQEISIKNGQILVEEQRLSPPWNGSISQFNGKITGIHSAKTSTKSQFQISGKLDDSAFSVEGESDFFSKDKNGSFSFELTDFPVADFHDQLAPLLDIDTSKGSFSIKQNSQWEDDSLGSSGTLTLTGIEPESPSSDSMLPLALLTDQKNSFSLGFTFTDQEPTSSSLLFDVMVARFNKLIIKSSVSPLLLAAGDFTDLIGNEFIEFKAGETIMPRKSNETAARYSRLLTANPNIGISITGNFDLITDSASIMMRLEEVEAKRVAAENRERFNEWQEQKEAYAKRYEQKREKLLKEGKIEEFDIPPKFLQEFIPTQPQPVTVEDAMLKDLADRRVNAVYQFFASEFPLEPERITIVEPEQPPTDDYGRAKTVTIQITALK